MITRITVALEVDRELVIPPFSSKVSKSILATICPDIEGILKGSDPNKPVSVSPLLLKGRPLLKYGDGGMLRLFPGNRYSFHATMIGDTARDLIDGLASLNEVGLFGGKAILLGRRLSVIRFEDLMLPESESYRMRFITPVILTLPASKERYGHARHVLFPHTFLIFYSLIDHWNAHAPRELIFTDPYRLSRYAYYNFMEVDHRIVPKTAIYDEKRRPRGFVGWAIFKRVKKSNRLDRLVRRLLAYANLVGIGRSRSIGFGMVRVEAIGSTSGTP